MDIINIKTGKLVGKVISTDNELTVAFNLIKDKEDCYILTSQTREYLKQNKDYEKEQNN